MKRMRIKDGLWVGISLVIGLMSGLATAQSARPIEPDKARIADHWTAERRAQAIPRELVIDPRGLGYLRRPDGTLVPYGHDTPPQTEAPNQSVSPFAGGANDTTPPTISGMDPAQGKTIGVAYTFQATVSDPSGVKSVKFNIQKSGSSLVNSFRATNTAGTDTWTVSVSGLTDGAWSWWVEAKDGARKGGNTARSDPVAFNVDTGVGGGGGGTDGSVVANAEWTSGGAIQQAAGRLYFEMPNNAKRMGPWTGYVCSGTVATDGTSGRSVILTAAHCVYDDANKAFARNVMFIPDQAGTQASGTDLNCSNDPIGCWIPSFGVVDKDWTTRTFPDNIEWDYAFYVVSDSGSHRAGMTAASDVLDTAAGSLAPSFASPYHDVASSVSDYTHALGYSYSEDPKLMYCAQDMTTEGAVNWWLASCGLSGGSSGGPWVQPLSSGSGPIISVNSWGYTNSSGMAGPKFFGTSAQCVFNNAIAAPFPSLPADGDAGQAPACGL